MKIRVYVRVETVDILLARKNETADWLAQQMSLSSIHAWNVVRGKVPVSPDVRKKLMGAFRGMSLHRGPATWDDFYAIREAKEA